MHEVSPQLFIDAVSAYQKTAAIKSAVELDLFAAIGAGADTADALAARTGAAARGLRILCDYLTVLGFLEKAGARYALTSSTATFLDSGSPTYMGSIVHFLAAEEMMGLFLADPAAYVRKGGSLGLANVAPDNPVWVKFAAAMTPFMAPTAEMVAGRVAAQPTAPKKVLDIAAGHGLFGIAVAKVVPTAEITAVDWQAVLAVAQANAVKAGVASRYRILAGSAFDVEWGAGFDLVLLPNFLHHFDQPTCIGLLKKCRDSLAPGGRVMAVEFVPDESRVAPPFPAMFAYMMLATTPAGDAFSEADYQAMAKEAGYRGVAVTPLPPSPQSLVAFAP